MDLSNSGNLSKQEVKMALSALETHDNDDLIDALFQRMDRDKSGNVTY